MTARPAPIADQCAEVALNTCDPNAECTDGPNGFDCACGDGLTGDGKGCADVDECDGGDDDCVANAECANTFGGYSCACAPGFVGDGAMECKGLCDIAAADGGPTCDAHGLCRVSKDRAVCDSCAAGYSGGGDVLRDDQRLPRAVRRQRDPTTSPRRSASATRVRAPAPARRATAAAIPTPVVRAPTLTSAPRTTVAALPVTLRTPPTTAAPTLRAASTATARRASRRTAPAAA